MSYAISYSVSQLVFIYHQHAITISVNYILLQCTYKGREESECGDDRGGRVDIYAEDQVSCLRYVDKTLIVYL